MTIKTLDLSLGLIKAAQVDPPGVAVPTLAPGQVLASGYYTDPATGQVYYYNATLDQWYYLAAGYLYALGISWQASPSAKIDVVGGVDTIRFRLSFKYVGPAVTQKFYAAVGDNKTSGTFDEWDGWQVRKDIALPQCSVVTTFTDKYIDLPIKTGKDGQDLAAYCKKDQLLITEGVDSTPYYYNVGHIILAAGEFTELKITKFEKV